MPRLNCGSNNTVKGYTKAVNCLDRILLTRVAIQSGANVDMANIADTNEEISALALTGAETWNEIESDIEFSTYSCTYDSTTGYYETVLTFDRKAFNTAIRDADLSNQSFCDLVFWVAFSDCTQKFIGLDKVGSDWKQLFRSKVTGHEETKGGQSDAANVVTFTSKSLTPPPFTTVDETTIFA